MPSARKNNIWTRRTSRYHCSHARFGGSWWTGYDYIPMITCNARVCSTVWKAGCCRICPDLADCSLQVGFGSSKDETAPNDVRPRCALATRAALYGLMIWYC